MSANISVGREQTTARAWVGVMLNVGEISEIWIAKGPRLRSLCRPELVLTVSLSFGDRTGDGGH